GLPVRRIRSTSRQMVSEPVTDPPGLSTRSTIADTSSSAAASRRPAATVSPPALDVPNGSTCGPPRPLTIGPCTLTTATVGLGLRPGSAGTDGIDGPDRGAVALAYRDRYNRGGASGSVSASPVSGEIPGAPVSSAIRA